MATYFDKIEITDTLILTIYEDDPAKQDAFLDKYLVRADEFYKSLLAKFGVNKISAPNYAKGMHFDCVNLLRYYIYQEVYFDLMSETTNGDDFMYRKYEKSKSKFEEILAGITAEKLMNINFTTSTTFTIPRIP